MSSSEAEWSGCRNIITVNKLDDGISIPKQSTFALYRGLDGGTYYGGRSIRLIDRSYMHRGIKIDDILVRYRTKVDQDYDSLEVGKYADFLVLKNDPLKDVSAVEQADKQVYQHGKRKY